jgi:hypothetical protein
VARFDQREAGIVEATSRYESWLAQQIPLIKPDLSSKHAAMSAGIFPFLRATFYRWAARWRGTVEDVAVAPRVLAVGDLHVDNFGTWRDSEGRLIWGVNDFDEAWPLPYTNDLIRLATSALLAVDSDDLAIERKRAVAAILDGYEESLAKGGGAFVLAEGHAALREMAVDRLHDPEKFWDKLEAFPTVRTPVPSAVLAALERALPERNLEIRIVHRVAGLGSLGRQRFVALARWRGGRVAREAKALAPSACVLAERDRASSVSYGAVLRRALWVLRGTDRQIHYKAILGHGVRCPDPCVNVTGRWLIRRLAPDCSRIPLNVLPKKRDAERLLYAMGWETANVHLGSTNARVVLADLNRRGKRWLYEAASRMIDAIEEDWRAWRKVRADYEAN